MDLSAMSTEELMRLRAAPAPKAPAADLSGISTEELMKMRGADDPTGSFGENVKAGAGKTFYDLARGAGQFLRDALTPSSQVLLDAEAKRPSISGMIAPKKPIQAPNIVADALGLPTQQDIDDARALDKPLMDTAGGMVGNIGAGAVLAAPTALLPGAASPVTAGLVGGAMGALQPVPTGGDRATNAAIGTVVGSATQAGANAVGGAMANRAAAKTADAAAEQAQNATRDAALAAGRQAGYVAPPSAVKPGLVNEAIESIGGKQATQQSFSLKNQKVTDRLAREYIELSPNSILSKASLADAKNIAAKPYRDVAAVSDDAATALKEWKQANYEAKRWFKYANKEGDPNAFDTAFKFRKEAEGWLDLIEGEASKLGRSELTEALKAARIKLGKMSTVESALTGGGHVDATIIAKIGERFPFDGQMKTVADFASNFKMAMRPPEKIGGMAHALRPGIGAGVGTMVGGPVGAAVGAATGVAVPWTVRQAMMSGAGQAAMATPAYAGGGTAKTIAELLANPAVRAGLPQAASAAALQHRAQQ
jgi:hypothetical protein